MAASLKTISNLAILTTPTGNTLLPVDHTANGVTNTYQLSVTNLFTNCSSNLTVSNSAILSANTLIIRNNQTPANSTVTVTKGTMFYDSNYLYIAVSNNSLKRVSLSSF